MRTSRYLGPRVRVVALAVGLVHASGCLAIAGIDGFRVDEQADAGPPADGAPAPDTSRPDVSQPDTSVPDTSVPDSAVPDTSVPDTSVPVPTGLSDVTLPGTGVPTGGKIVATLTTRDDAGNPVRRTGAQVSFTATGGTSVVSFGTVTDLGDGRYTSVLTGVQEGTPLEVSAVLDGTPLRSPKPSLRVANAPTSGLAFHVDAENADGAGNFGGKGCPAAGRASWKDLSANAVTGTLAGFTTPCGAGSGWAGQGTPDDPYRLTLDGTDDHVSFGATASLTKHTLVAWVRQTGAGTLGSSGNGGLAAVFPILTKGTGEAENAMVDINYYLGLDELGHLATDYEHVTTSTNAPLTGTAKVTDGTWVMLSSTLDAQASVRANAVNATQDVQLAPTAGPSPGTASLLVVGGANRSNGMASGRFKGDVAVVRTYDRALTPQELVATCHAYSARFRILTCPK
ncbi:MAG: LamG-like jellyroll fold domain-containing protein [Polyangiaceae bacterium]